MKESKYNIIKKYNGNLLIYNSFSKANILLEKHSNTKMFKDIEEFNKLKKEEQKLLIDNGFIIDNNRNEYDEVKYIFEQKYFDNQFFNIVLVPTLSCNFKCPYCFEKDYTCGKDNIEKYFTVLKKYAEKNFKLHKFIQISLFGGEPLIYIDKCLEFLKWVKEDSQKNKYEFFTSIVTNGSLLTEDILKNLLKYNLFSLQITIDSDKEKHDQTRIFKTGKPSFDLLIDKVNMLIPISRKYSNFKFILRINLNNTTVDKVKDSLKGIKESNRKDVNLLIRAIYNTHAYNECNSNSVNELQEYFDMGIKMGFNILKEKYNYQTCEACGDRKFFYLMPDLSMWKCINDLGFKEACFGNIDDNGDVTIIPENVVAWYNYSMGGFNDKKCQKCPKLPDCLGGCPLYRAKHNGQRSCRSFDMACLPFIY